MPRLRAILLAAGLAVLVLAVFVISGPALRGVGGGGSESVVGPPRAPSSSSGPIGAGAQGRERSPVVQASEASPTGSLEVHVLRARTGEPAPGVELGFRLWRNDAGDRKRRGFTDAGGVCVIEGIHPGGVEICSALGAGGLIDVAAGERARSDLQIRAGFTVRGRVVDEEGEGVAGARLWLSAWYRYEIGFLVGDTASDGSFVLYDVPPERFLGALAPRYGPTKLEFLSDHQTSGESSDVELTLVLCGPGGGLSILVTDEAGAPEENALVQVRCGDMEPVLDLWTDAAGAVLVQGLPLDTHVSVFADGKAPWSENVRIERYAERQLSIVLADAGDVTGIVRSGEGKPVGGARLAQAGSHDWLFPSAETGPDGSYRIGGLPTGPVSLRASHDEYGGAEATIEISADAPAAWDPVLNPRRVVTGRVVDEDGEPLADWSVEAELDAGRSSRWAETGRDGRFRLLNCDAGFLWLNVHRGLDQEPVPTKTVLVSPVEDEITIRIDAGDLRDGSLSGTVVDGAGVGVRRAELSLLQPHSECFVSETDSGGRFTIEHLPSGHCDVVVHARGFPGLRLARLELRSGEHRELPPIVLGPAGDLRILVDGRPPAESEAFSKFHIRPAAAPPELAWFTLASYDPWDETDAIPLVSGDYELVACGDRSADQVVPFQIRGDTETRLDLTPREGRPVRLGVRIPEDEARPPSVSVFLRDSRGVLLREVTFGSPSPDDLATSATLAPGTYSLQAEAPDGRRAELVFDVELTDPLGEVQEHYGVLE